MFRTPLVPSKSKEQIDLHDPVLLMGSCFAENIGLKLQAYKFRSLLNPFGVIYNPYSIFKLLLDSLDGAGIDESFIIENQEIYRHFDFHSNISSSNLNDLMGKAASAYQQTAKFMGSSRWIIFSLGTSLVYKLKNSDRIVANCHKLPSDRFDPKMLSVEEITVEFKRVYDSVMSVNPKINFILTVSPIRHLKDTLPTNSLSKSILRVAVNEIIQAHSNTSYFPSYEIMMDDLRDYRFYASDMLHPNQDAINYIWEMFMDSYFNDQTRKFIAEWSKIINALNHKPFNPESKPHKRFIENSIQQLKSFESLVDISEELQKLEGQLHE